MKALLFAALLGISVFMFSGNHESAGAVPPRPEQQRPDIFPCPGCSIRDVDGNGIADMQDLNPTTLKAKQTRSIRYRVVTLQGCSAGTMLQDLDYMNRVEAPKAGLDLAIDNARYDFTVYISCGLTQVNKCGSVNVFCLPDNFPYNTDVYMSDVLSSWDTGSRVGIPLHEIVGHAIGTWNEQYATCGASCNFQPTPNQRDIMNTGPLSRHGLEAVELERVERTLWPLTAPCELGPVEASGLYWDGCRQRWVNSDGWTFDPITGIWYTPAGIAEWGQCIAADRDCWHIPSSRWIFGGSVLFDPATGTFSAPPLP